MKCSLQRIGGEWGVWGGGGGVGWGGGSGANPHTQKRPLPYRGDKPVKGFVYEVSLYSRLTATETMTAGEVSLRGKASDNGGDQRPSSAANILR